MATSNIIYEGSLHALVVAVSSPDSSVDTRNVAYQLFRALQEQGAEAQLVLDPTISEFEHCLKKFCRRASNTGGSEPDSVVGFLYISGLIVEVCGQGYLVPGHCSQGLRELQKNKSALVIKRIMANAFISLEEILQSLSAADFTVPILCLDSFQSPPEELTPPECYQTPGHPPGTLSAFDDTALKGRRGTALALSAAPGTLAPPPSPGQPGPFAAALIGKLVGGASLGEALHTLPFEVANIDGEQEAFVKLTGKATAALRPRPGAAPRDVSAVLATSPANVAPVAGPLSGPRPPEKKASFIIGAPAKRDSFRAEAPTDLTVLQQRAVAPPRITASFGGANPPSPSHSFALPAYASASASASTSARHPTPVEEEPPSPIAALPAPPVHMHGPPNGGGAAYSRAAAAAAAASDPSHAVSPSGSDHPYGAPVRQAQQPPSLAEMAAAAGSLVNSGVPLQRMPSGSGSSRYGSRTHLAATLEEQEEAQQHQHQPGGVSPANSFVSVTLTDVTGRDGRSGGGRLSESNTSVGSVETDPGASYNKMSPNRSLAGSPPMGYPLGRSSTPDWAKERTPPGTPESKSPRRHHHNSSGGAGAGGGGAGASHTQQQQMTPESLAASLAALASISEKGTAAIRAGAHAGAHGAHAVAHVGAHQPPPGLSAVLGYMAADRDNLQLQTQGIFAIRSLSGVSSGAAAGAAEAGAVDAIVLAMDCHGADPHLQADACKTLRLLAVETASRTRCLRDGAVRAVVAAMRGHLLEEPVQVQACGALGAIAALERNRAPMVAEGVVDAILAAMSAHLDSPDVATHACRALGNITSVAAKAAGALGDSGAAASTSGGAAAGGGSFSISGGGGGGGAGWDSAAVVQSIVATLRRHGGVAGVQRYGCRVLSNVGGVDSGAVGSAVRQGVAAAVSAMRSSADDAAAQAYGCAALWSLSTSPEGKRAAAASGAIEAVVRAMSAHPSVIEVQSQGTGALWSLMYDSDTRSRAGECRVVEAVVSAMRQFPQSVDLNRQACVTLWSLTLHNDNKGLVAQSGAIERIIAAMQAFPEAPDLHTHAIGCLGSIVASPDDEIAALAARHGLKAVVASMRTHPNHPEVNGLGARALRNMSACNLSEVKSSLGSAMRVLTDSCHSFSKHPKILVDICKAISNVAIGWDRPEHAAVDIAVAAVDLIITRHPTQEELQKHAQRAAHNLRYVKKNIIPSSPGDAVASPSGAAAGTAGPPPPRGSRSLGARGSSSFSLTSPSPEVGGAAGAAGGVGSYWAGVRAVSWLAGVGAGAGSGFGGAASPGVASGGGGVYFVTQLNGDQRSKSALGFGPGHEGYGVHADPTHPHAMPSFSNPATSPGSGQRPPASPPRPGAAAAGTSFTFSRPAGGAGGSGGEWAAGSPGGGGGAASMASSMSRGRPTVFPGQSSPGGRPARSSDPAQPSEAMHVPAAGSPLSRLLESGGGGGGGGASPSSSGGATAAAGSGGGGGAGSAVSGGGSGRGYAQEVPREESLAGRGGSSGRGAGLRAGPPRAVSSFKF